MDVNFRYFLVLKKVGRSPSHVKYTEIGNFFIDKLLPRDESEIRVSFFLSLMGISFSSKKHSRQGSDCKNGLNHDCHGASNWSWQIIPFSRLSHTSLAPVRTG